MKRIVSMILAVAMVAVFVIGCAETSPNSFKEEADKIASVMVSDYGATSIQYALIDNGKIFFVRK